MEGNGNQDLHWIVTDSGIGGVSVCAEIERNLRQAEDPRNIRITYFNSWPYQDAGYNALPDAGSRARVFDHALLGMDRYRPDRIIIACNTLSILYPLTEHSRTAAIPVTGIIDAGVSYFCEALNADPASSILLLGTRTTIESQVHRNRLIGSGIPEERIIAASCHGLAAAIEQGGDGAAIEELIEECLSAACRSGVPDAPLYAGLCCTHYTYVRESIRLALERKKSVAVRILDPNRRLADLVVPPAPQTSVSRGGNVSVGMVSKVELDDRRRHAVAEYVAPVSDITARALLSYNHIPDLF